MSVLCCNVFGDVGLLSAFFRQCLFIVGTCSTSSDKCREVFGEFGFLSGRVRRCRFSVGT